MKKYLVLVMIIVLSLSLTGCMDFLNVDSASKDYYDLRMEEPRGEGEVTPEEGRHRIEAGSTVPITAEPEDDWVFMEWRGNNIASTDSENSEILVEDDSSVKAIFVEDIIREVIVESNINVDINGEGRYNSGEEVEVSAGEKSGYVFNEWTVEEPDYLNLYQDTTRNTRFTMPGEDVKLTAKYVEEIVKDVYIDVKIVDTEESLDINMEGEGKYNKDEEVEIAAGDKLGYSFNHWVVEEPDNLNLYQENTKNPSFHMPGEDVRLTAFYEEVGYGTVKIETDGEGEVEGEGRYTFGDDVEINAEPVDKWSFNRWKPEGFNFETPDSNETKFTMPESNTVNITAEFLKHPHLSIEANDDRGTVSGGGRHPFGETVDINADPKDGYRFVEWEIIDGENYINIDEMNEKETSLDMPDKNETTSVTIKANFEVGPPEED